MQIPFTRFLRLIRKYTNLATSNFSYAIYASEKLVKTSTFVYTTDDWHIPAGTKIKFTPADKKNKIPDYIRNVQLAAMSVKYKSRQCFVGYDSIDIIPDSEFLRLMVLSVFN